MATMQEIEKLMAQLGAGRDALAGAALAQDEEETEIKRRYAPRIRKLTAAFEAASEAVTAAVNASPELFVKPRSVILHGINAGWRKAKGKIEWDDDERVIALIKKHFANQVDELIQTVEKPVKSALNELSVGELKKLGIEVEETGDVAFVKLAEKEAAKLIRALLRKASKEPAEEVEA